MHAASAVAIPHASTRAVGPKIPCCRLFQRAHTADYGVRPMDCRHHRPAGGLREFGIGCHGRNLDEVIRIALQTRHLQMDPGQMAVRYRHGCPLRSCTVTVYPAAHRAGNPLV